MFVFVIDSLYDIIFWVLIVFFIFIVGVMVWFVFVYCKCFGYMVQKFFSYNMIFEIVWFVLLSLILVFFFVVGVWGFMDMCVLFDEMYIVYVYVKQWVWWFVYFDGEESVVLYILKNIFV